MVAPSSYMAFHSMDYSDLLFFSFTIYFIYLKNTFNLMRINIFKIFLLLYYKKNILQKMQKKPNPLDLEYILQEKDDIPNIGLEDFDLE